MTNGNCYHRRVPLSFLLAVHEAEVAARRDYKVDVRTEKGRRAVRKTVAFARRMGWIRDSGPYQGSDRVDGKRKLPKERC